MRQFQPLKLSQFHKAKTCWLENSWSSGIMSNFLGQFFYVLGVKNLSFEFCFLHCRVRTKKLLDKKVFFFFLKFGKFF